MVWLTHTAQHMKREAWSHESLCVRQALSALLFYMCYVIAIPETQQSTAQDSHVRGGARFLSCAKTSWPLSVKPPVSRKEVFCCQKEEVTLCECPLRLPETGYMSAHNALTWRSKHYSKSWGAHARSNSTWQDLILSQTDTFADMALALNCMIMGSHSL